MKHQILQCWLFCCDYNFLCPRLNLLLFQFFFHLLHPLLRPCVLRSVPVVVRPSLLGISLTLKDRHTSQYLKLSSILIFGGKASKYFFSSADIWVGVQMICDVRMLRLIVGTSLTCPLDELAMLARLWAETRVKIDRLPLETLEACSKNSSHYLESSLPSLSQSSKPGEKWGKNSLVLNWNW